MRFISVILLTTILAVGLADPAPTLTPGPLDPRAITATIFTPTEYWDYATTSISKDDYFMGIVKVTSPDGLWYLHCINAPLTTTNGHAGCGSDDLYTSCSGATAFGIDGDAIRCTNGFQCVTHKIFEDFEAYSSSSSTPFLGCGKATASLEMIRTPPASFEPGTTTTDTAVGSFPTGTRASNTASTTSGGIPVVMHVAAPVYLAIVSALSVVFVVRVTL